MTTHDPVRFVAKNMRVDLRLIAEMIAPGSRVLDIGCGDGMLIDHLSRTKGCDARGIEIDMTEVIRAVAHGMPVMHGDADTDLAHYPDGAFDYVVLSRTLQAVEQPRVVLRQMLRIGDARGGEFSEFRPLAGALAAGQHRADADDACLGSAVARDAEHPPLHDPRLLRVMRARRLCGGELARRGRRRRAHAVAALSAPRQPVRRTRAVPAAARRRRIGLASSAHWRQCNPARNVAKKAPLKAGLSLAMSASNTLAAA